MLKSGGGEKGILLTAEEEFREHGVCDEAVNDRTWNRKWVNPKMRMGESENGYYANTLNFVNILYLDLEYYYHLYYV